MISLFALTLELSARLQNIGGSAFAAIGRRWKTRRQIYKQILALKEFSQSIFFVQKKALKFELLIHCLL